jgi:hypothetical protein
VLPDGDALKAAPEFLEQPRDETQKKLRTSNETDAGGIWIWKDTAPLGMHLPGWTASFSFAGHATAMPPVVGT